MPEQPALTPVGESFDSLRSDVRNRGRYVAELEELIEGYRAFAARVTLSTSGDRKARGKLLKKIYKILGPPLNDHQEQLSPVGREAEKAASGNEIQAEKRFTLKACD